MTPHIIAKVGHSLSWLINCLPNKLATQIYSSGRYYFMKSFYQHQIPPVSFDFDKKWQRNLWGIEFRLPLMNSAGIFKNGEGYQLVANQGAGGYIGGTSTNNPRIGNIKNGIAHPFITLPKSHTTLNYLGLPNLGDETLAKIRVTSQKVNGCPIGWSLMRSPDYEESNALDRLIKSLWLYHNNPLIDFIEINESCPNIKVDAGDITRRLRHLSTNFLMKRSRKLPVILKLSNDLPLQNLPKLLDELLECKFDGINLGNTSTDYIEAKKNIKDYKEQQLFDYFTSSFGGGVGGSILKSKSLSLCEAAVNYLEMTKPDYEFHIIRTGGINSIQDIIDSNNAGIALNQWYTGYFENYIAASDNLYSKLFKDVIC